MSCRHDTIVVCTRSAWEAVIKNRVTGSTCPYCSHRKVLAGVNDLATVRPELALDWSPRNGKLKADMVSEFSNRKVWWKCHVCGYEWQSLISARSGGVKCLCCSGYVTVSGKNDLSITHPVLAKEWSDSNERGVTFVKGSIHVRFMGQTDNKA